MKPSRDGWLREKLAKARGKAVDKIPRGDYCYDWVPLEEATEEERECYNREKDALGVLQKVFGEEEQAMVERFCPYWRIMNAPPMCCCDFLEEQALPVGSEEACKEALAYYGSEEELEKHCSGSILLGDAVRCCGAVLEALGRQSTCGTESG
jgi:hypothetical protein